MSTYTEQHYEDVARLIKESWPEAVPEDVNEVILFSLANRFADFFDADNPSYCTYCLRFPEDQSPECSYHADNSTEHNSKGGFDREQFLTACGLERVGGR